MIGEGILINEYQTPFDLLEIDKEPQEVQDQFWDCINNIPLVRNLISIDRPRAKDLPRDELGRIIVDVTRPHILEDMDYFRQTAITFQKTGRFTHLRPNGNPNSEYMKWLKEEVRRCVEGYVRPSDGEWITGDYYFFLNFCPILQADTSDSGKTKGKKMAKRISDFPKVWEGHYLRTHYLQQARENGNHASELSRRGSGKSYVGGSLLSKRFVIGESKEVCKEVQCVVTAYEKKYISGANQILDMFKKYIDFLAINTELPSKRLVDSSQNLTWKMGYKDLDTGADKGTLNSVIGITSKDDESKLRGSRGVLYIIEEAGTFPRLLGLYATLRPSVEDGDSVFGLIYAYGTSGDEDSDFAALQEIMYNPKGYNMYALKNVYDKEGQGRPNFVFFFPGYMNRSNCYDNNGNSDVTKAILEILKDRFTVKYNSSDVNAVTKRISEIPITPQEAILRAKSNLFPITDLNERLNQIDNNPSEFDDVYVGNLVPNDEGGMDFRVSNSLPIRDFPIKDNKNEGAIEIFRMPEKDHNGRVFDNRYIVGHDPVDDDEAQTASLTSTFVLDLFTDQIVAEYTGRHMMAEDNFEIVRRLCIFYNAKCLYESNKKGIFAYFQEKRCVHLLADTPSYLKDIDIVKSIGFGNKAKGVNATHGVNAYANKLIKEWLLKVNSFVKTLLYKDDNGEEYYKDVEVQEFNLYNIRNRALLKELIQYNNDGNFDRVRALGMVMLYRQQYLILYGGDVKEGVESYDDADYLGNDPFFTNNYGM
jgi:hypothetical protein